MIYQRFTVENKGTPRVTLRLHQLGKNRDEKKERTKGNTETDNHENR